MSNHYGQAFEHGARGHAVNQKTSQKVTGALSITQRMLRKPGLRKEHLYFSLLGLQIILYF